ncbi:MAG: dGTP triphosphohydrolase [Bryobacteraceae bacterium]|jgi:dGTPase
MLERLRFPVERSRGRRYPEPPHPYRNAFQRDRDRIVHSRSFRRLEAKTQVFTPALSDHFRNRLTHTIEVAQISRTVASVLGLDEDLTEALALVHDVGHPPFAHAGESALNRQMSRFGERFDHNWHALRVVESFEQRYAAFPGLNLTFELREGIVKHSRDFGPGESPELDEYLPGLRPPLEAQLIDLADEVAYTAGDLDDAYAAGILTPDAVAAESGPCAEILEKIRAEFPAATEREWVSESVRQLIDRLVTGLIDGTLWAAREAGLEDFEAVRAHPERVARFTPEIGALTRSLKQLMYAKVYCSEPLAEDRRRSAARIGELFEFFLESPGCLPPGYRERAETTPVHRVICDYLAGMTDGFFNRVYAQTVGKDS